MRRADTTALLPVACCLLLAACAGHEGAQNEPHDDGNNAMTGKVPGDPAASDKAAATQAAGILPPELLAALTADLAARSGAPSSADIRLRSARAMTWNDGSLGCPQPGFGYTQALVPGYWVILELDGREYDYRATRRGHFQLCENPPAEPGGREDAAHS